MPLSRAPPHAAPLATRAFSQTKTHPQKLIDNEPDEEEFAYDEEEEEDYMDLSTLFQFFRCFLRS